MLYGSRSSIIVSFVFYSLFRTFLVTFTFAYLADSLGFHYFGVLAGVVFVISGFTGLLQYPLRLAVSGTCYKQPLNSVIECDRGHWQLINTVMLVSFVLLLVFSYRDYWRRQKTQQNLRAVVSFHSFASFSENTRLLPPHTAAAVDAKTESSGESKYNSVHT